MVKRLLSAITAVFLLFAAFEFTAVSTQQSDILYITDEYGAIVTGCDKNASFKLTVPESLGGRSVYKIADGAFAGCISIAEVHIPSGVRQIEAGAFYDMPSLRKITVSELNVYYTTDAGALYTADKTELVCYFGADAPSFTVPSGVEAIAPGAFYNSSLESVILPEGLRRIENDAFRACASLTAVDIPDTVETIGERAFSLCSSLAWVKLPSSLEKISNGAFSACTALAGITVSPGCTEIGDEAFLKCVGLRYLLIPDSVTTVGAGAFFGLEDCVIYSASQQAHLRAEADGAECRTLSFGKGLRVESAAFTAVNAYTSVGYGLTPELVFTPAEAECKEYILVSADPETVAVDGKSVLALNTGTAKVYAYTADGGICAELTVRVSQRVSLLQSAHPYGNDIDETKSYTVSGSPSKIAVTFSTDTYTEKDRDFIYIYDKNNESVGVYSGAELSGRTLIIPTDTVKIRLTSDSAEDAYGYVILSIQSADNLTFAESIALDKTTLTLEYGESTYLGAKTSPESVFLSELHFVSSDTSVATVSRHGEVSAVGAGEAYITVVDAISGMTAQCMVTVTKREHNGLLYTSSGTEVAITRYIGSASSVEVPSSINGLPVTSIMGDAFTYATTLTEVKLPASVTSIADGAFAGCTSLVSITVDSASTRFCTVGGSLYSRDMVYLHTVPAGLSGTFEIPTGVVTVSPYAFNLCIKLEKIIIGSSVRGLPARAFDYCLSLSEFAAASGAPYTVRDGVLFNSTSNTLLVYPAAKTGVYTVPGTVHHIGQGAFRFCVQLDEVRIPSSVQTVAADAFCYSVTLGKITVDPSNTSFADEGGILFNKTKTILLSCPPSYAGGYVIPATVTEIGDYAFCRCDGLEDVYIPPSVRSIGAYSFFGADMLSVVILPPNTATVGRGAFGACSNIRLVCPDGITAFGVDAVSEGGEILCCYGTVTEAAAEAVSLAAKNTVYYYGESAQTFIFTPRERISPDESFSVSLAAGADSARASMALPGKNTDAFVITLTASSALSYSSGFTVDIPVAYAEFELYRIDGADAQEVIYTKTARGIRFAAQTGIYAIAYGTASAEDTEIEVCDPAVKTVYTYGESFEQDGMTIYVKNYAGIVRRETDGFVCTGALDRGGDNTVTVVYNSLTAAFTVRVSADALTGTARITGEAVWGQTLTAVFENISPSNVPTVIAWYRDGAVIPDANRREYTVTAQDIGCELSVGLSAANGFEGEVISAGVRAERAENTQIPEELSLASHTHDTITLLARDGYEYRRSGVYWQDSPVFAGLEPQTEYRFYQRIKQTATHTVSDYKTAYFSTTELREIASDVYTVNSEKLTISSVVYETTVQTLLAGITPSAGVRVYKADGVTQASDTDLVGSGMKVCLYSGENVYQTLTVIVTGDLNGDGRITITDFVRMKTRMLDKAELGGVYENAADINGNGSVTITDFVQMKSHMLKETLITPKPY